jgi:plasmid replication initiation protein
MAAKSLKRPERSEKYDIQTERSNGELQVNMSNALTSAAQGLSLAEKRIMCLAIGKLDSKQRANPMSPPTVKINAAEFAETFGVDMNTAYEQLQDAGDHLFKRQIGFQKPGGKKGPITVRMRWVGSVHYHKGEGWVALAFWHEVVPFLLGLQKQFTSYKLAQASSLRSLYSWRLLELLSQFEATGWRDMDIEEFCHAVEAPPSCTADFGQLRRRVIEPAVKELTKKDGWLIQWRPVKRGRKVSGLRFEFRRDPQGRLL